MKLKLKKKKSMELEHRAVAKMIKSAEEIEPHHLFPVGLNEF